jgi:bifunctional enzyme CysN/CysC
MQRYGVALPKRARRGHGASTIEEIYIGDAATGQATAGDSVCVTLAGDLDVGRGNVLSPPDEPLSYAAQFRAQLIWLAEKPLIPGREYLLKLNYASSRASVTAIRSRRDPATGSALAARQLDANEIGDVHISLAEPIPYAAYSESKQLGGFILIDRETTATIAAGVIQHELRRGANLTWHLVNVDRQAREQLLGQRPCCIWLTGLSGSGKSTIANALESHLHAQGRLTYLLDGDNVRHGLNADLGFDEADRAENIRRVAEVARLMVDAGIIVIVALISPFAADRQRARTLFDRGEFIEVHVDAPVDVCAGRDPKGLYAKARAGQIPNFTGVSSPYEPPLLPEIRVDTTSQDLAECVSLILALMS